MLVISLSYGEGTIESSAVATLAVFPFQHCSKLRQFPYRNGNPKQNNVSKRCKRVNLP